MALIPMWPVADWSAVLPILLPWLGAWLVVLVVLIGLLIASAAAMVTGLRRRFPTDLEQRAFLLRGRMYHGKEYHFPRLSEAQRLEWMKGAGWGLALFFLIYPSTVLTEWVCGRLGWLTFDHGLNHTVVFRLRLAISLFALLFVLTSGAYALAVGWLAGGVLRRSKIDPQATSSV